MVVGYEQAYNYNNNEHLNPNLAQSFLRNNSNLCI